MLISIDDEKKRIKAIIGTKLLLKDRTEDLVDEMKPRQMVMMFFLYFIAGSSTRY